MTESGVVRNRIVPVRGSQRVRGRKATVFAESAQLAELHRSVDLSIGVPEFACAEPVQQAAVRAILDGHNQYSPIGGTAELRGAVARHAARFRALVVDPQTMVLITAGATEAVLCAMLALIDPGDEVIVFEPFYDAYPAQIGFAGGAVRTVALQPPADGSSTWSFDRAALASAFGPRTRALLLNTPHNPTGKVFAREELAAIAELCIHHDVVAVCDEVYEHIIYPDARHVALASLPGMAERTITIGSGGKTFNATGWKVGWAIAAPPLIELMRHTHQYVTATVPGPFQLGIAAGLALPDSYFAGVANDYLQRKQRLCDGLAAAGLRVPRTDGAYFVLVDVKSTPFLDDHALCRFLIETAGVAAIPCAAFFTPSNPLGTRWARFAFCKSDRTLHDAVTRLVRLYA